MNSKRISHIIPPNELLYAEGEAIDGVYRLKVGSVATFKNYQSQKVLLCLYDEYQVVGWSNLKSQTALHSAVALTHLEVDFIAKQMIEEFAEKDFEFGMYTIKILCKEVKEIEQKRITLLNKNATQRVAYLLLELLKKEQIKQQKNIIILPNTEILAELLGISLAHFRKILMDFEIKQWIETHHQIITFKQLQPFEQLLGIKMDKADNQPKQNFGGLHE